MLKTSINEKHVVDHYLSCSVHVSGVNLELEAIEGSPSLLIASMINMPSLMKECPHCGTILCMLKNNSTEMRVCTLCVRMNYTSADWMDSLTHCLFKKLCQDCLFAIEEWS